MKLFIQLLFIFLAFSFIALMLGLRFAPPNNALDQLLRPSLIRSSLARRLLQLDRIGDDRYQLTSSSSPLSIQVWYAPGVKPNPQLTQWLKDMVEATVDRPIQITVQTLDQSPPASISDNNLKQIMKTLPAPDPATITILYLPSSQTAPTNAGQAINAATIVLFTDTINDLSERSQIRDMIEQSTLMHEWGHLLGLEHIDRSECIMNERVEVYGNRRFQGSNLPTAYCPEELYQLKSLGQR